jgi:anaerobic magnesium-protoporphyrin IX monomethyl ester cyclase
MDNIKILLIFPIRPKNLRAFTIPPLGLGYVASALSAAKFSVEILDCAKENMDYAQFDKYINSTQFDIYGFTLYNQDVKAVLEMIKIIKLSPGDKTILVGGPYVSSNSETAMQTLVGADYGFVGEAEEGIVELAQLISTKSKAISNLDLSSISNILYCDDDRTLKQGPRKYVENLNTIPMPAWDLLLKKPYPNTPSSLIYKHSNSAPIISSRGCPYHCTYCVAEKIHGRKLRRRNIENVVAEIEMLRSKYGKKEFQIWDDNFTFDREEVIKFCKLVVAKKLNVSFASPNGVRLDSLDEEVLQWMKKAGWYLLAVGIESGNDNILKDMNKNLTVKTITEKIELIRKAKIEVHGFFIIGYPTETRETIAKTCKYALSLDLIGCSIFCFRPFPGTWIYQDLQRQGKLQDVSEGTYAEVSYVPEGMTAKELKKIQRNTILKFYLRPKIIFKITAHIRTFEHFKGLIKRAIEYMT